MGRKKIAATAPAPASSSTIQNIRFQNIVGYEEAGYRPCRGESPPNCFGDYGSRYEDEGDEDRYSSCSDYCRCYKIDSITVTPNEIYRTNIVKAVCSEFGFSEDETEAIIYYGIDRILSVNRVYDPLNYSASWGGSYYGEVVDRIEFTGNILAIDFAIRSFVALPTLKEKVEYLLMAEYGYVLDQLKNREWKIDTVNKKSLVLPSTEHARKLDQSIVTNYGEWPWFHALCIKDGKHYRVVDGYHRTTALLNSHESKARIIYTT